MVKTGAMALKAVVPGMPKSVKDRELLEEDLRRIGCHGFLGKPSVRPSFLEQLETIVKTPFKTPGQGPSFRLPVSSPTPASVGTDTQETPEVSGSIRSVDKGTE